MDRKKMCTLLAVILVTVRQSSGKEAPVIGILAVDSGKREESMGKSMISAAYVNGLLSAGGRVVPLPLSWTVHEHRNMFKQINGLFLPGGMVTPFTSKTLGVLKRYVQWAITANRQGQYFPIWGTCLGFENLILSFTNVTDALQRCNVTNELLTLERTKYFKYSRIFRQLPARVLNAIQHEPVAPNFHRWCVTEESLRQSRLENVFVPTTFSYSTRRQLKFIESVEHSHFPFYGIAWHPEKNVYEHDQSLNLTHSDVAVALSSSLFRFFIKEATKNNHKFAKDFDKFSIFNHCPIYTAKQGYKYEQAYFFP